MRRLATACTLLAAAAACSDDGGAIVDARPIDAVSIDSTGNDPDAATPMVTVEVSDTAGPLAGVPVQFLNADGTEVATLPTGADGRARATMAAGGSATAMIPDPNLGPTRLKTWLGVAPGDVLRARVAGTFTPITIDLTIPANGSLGHYHVDTTCGSSDQLLSPTGTTVTFTMQLDGCGATTDFIVSSDNGDGGPVSTFVQTGVAVADQAAVTLTAPGGYQALADATQSYTNLPQTITFMSFGRLVLSTTGVPWTWQISADVIGGTAAGTVQVPALPAAGAISAVTAEASDSPWSRHLLFEAPAGLTYTLDTTGQLLHGFTASANYDIDTHQVTWTESTDGAAPDLTVVRLRIDHPATESSWLWDVVAPHADTIVTVPTLLGDSAQWNPTASDFVAVDDHLTAKVPGGYAAARPVVFLGDDPTLIGAALHGRVSIEQQQLLAGRRTRTTAPRARR